MFSLSLGLALMPFAVAKVFDVQVGQNGLAFSPDAVSAAVGDQVTFHFHPKNHSVTRSSFASPCSPLDGGFDSGFHAVAANVSADSLPTYTVTVNDTNPVWVFCNQAANTPASHCGQGMIFAVNCPRGDVPNSLDNFKKAALSIGASLSAAATATQPAGTDDATPALTAPYGDVTLPPALSATLVTVPITLDSTSIWTTTYTSFQNSPAATPAAAEGQVHTVIVGGTGKLYFTPDHIEAAPRDIVQFQFQQVNHSVIQSSFADPCRRLNANNASAPLGFHSGFFSVGANDTEFPTWNLTVNDTAPIWAYCGQTSPKSHCGAGMVFAVNAQDSTPRNFSAFQSIAEQLNGTATNSTAGSTPTGAAISVRAGGASVFVALLAAAVSFI